MNKNIASPKNWNISENIHCVKYTAQKMKFSIKDFFSKCDQIRRKLLVTFTEEILNGNLHFLFCDMPELGFSMNWIFPCKDRIFFI